MNTIKQNLVEDTVQHKVEFAGFWIRLFASFVDALVLIPISILSIYNTSEFKNMLFAILLIIAYAVYKPIMETYYSATIGKMAFNLKVVDLEFKEIKMDQAIKRYIPWIFFTFFSILITILTYNNVGFKDIIYHDEYEALQEELGYDLYMNIANLILLISVLPVAFSKTKQGLHDQLAGTYCIYNLRKTENELTEEEITKVRAMKIERRIDINEDLD